MRVWAICVVALIASCGSGRPLPSGARPNGDAAPNDTASAVDDARPDQPGSDVGSGLRDLPCRVSTDCSPGLTCCLLYASDGTGGTVSCQPTCDPNDGTSYVACATSADCPAGHPNCVFLAPTTRGDFSICE